MDPDPGSVAFLNPRIQIRDKFFPNPGSPTHISKCYVAIFWVKNTQVFVNWPKSFLYLFKNKMISNLWSLWLQKREDNCIIFTLFCCWWIRDQGCGIRDGKKSGSGINIPDPQHCCVPFLCTVYYVLLHWNSKCRWSWNPPRNLLSSDFDWFANLGSGLFRLSKFSAWTWRCDRSASTGWCSLKTSTLCPGAKTRLV